MAEVKLISESLIHAVGDAAAQSPRLRMNHNFHTGPGDNPHRFLNVLVRGTYIRPHRHLMPPKAETFLVLEGAADVIVFDDEGAITARYRLGESSSEGRLWGVDLPPAVWHTILPRSERVVCFEVKPGAWEPSSDKEFASWAPAEGDAAAAEYSRSLMERD
jgi:cupin fold WbuC family metalloprotein